MFCPRCGQEQVSEETRFCSRCGFLLIGVAEVVANQGIIPEKYIQIKGGKDSPKKRGIKQGAMIMLIGTFLIVPLLVMICIGLRLGPFLPVFTAITTFMGGLLRIIYALMFETSNTGEKTLEQNMLATSQKFLNKQPPTRSLAPEQSIPISAYVPPPAGNWRDSNDLTPNSVTEQTTKLLQRDEN